MKKIITFIKLTYMRIFAITTILCFCITDGTAFAQQGRGNWNHNISDWDEHEKPQPKLSRFIPYSGGYYNSRSRVGFYPHITWMPQGAAMRVGPVTVGPYRRYVRFGINAGFSQVKGYSTYNIITGKSTPFVPYNGRK